MFAFRASPGRGWEKMSGNWEHVGWHPARIGMCWVCNQLDSDRACRNYGNLASCVISSKFDKSPRGGGVSEMRKAKSGEGLRAESGGTGARI